MTGRHGFASAASYVACSPRVSVGMHILAVLAILTCSGVTAVAQTPFNVLHDFTGLSHFQGPAAGLVQASDGHLYGTTAGGATSARGRCFALLVPV